MARLAINGYGRIGRCVLRALVESGRDDLQIVAINEPAADLASLAYLTRFDSTHGRFPVGVTEFEHGLSIGGRPLRVSHGRAAAEVDWAGLELDLLLDCSGSYSTRAGADAYLAAGVPRVLVSHPLAAAGEADATIVYGINQQSLSGRERIVSNASCTTNCIVPVLSVLDAAFGIEAGFISTLHSVMNDQPLIDAYHDVDLRRTRSAMQSMIPVSTGLARGIGRLLPQLDGRIQAKAVRVPTLNVSAMDTVLTLARATTAGEVNAILRAATEGPLAGLLAYTELPHASCDFNHDPHSGVVDGSLTRVGGDGRLVSLLAWFDNEWGFANRMLDVARHWLALSAPSTITTGTLR